MAVIASRFSSSASQLQLPPPTPRGWAHIGSPSATSSRSRGSGSGSECVRTRALHSQATSPATPAIRPAHGGPLFDAVCVDAFGTLLLTVEPVHVTYADISKRHGVDITPEQVKANFKTAFSQPLMGRLRYEGDGREFWRRMVASATGSNDPALFQELFQHFTHGSAWTIADGAVDALTDLRAANVRLAVVSNFDTRLRSILHQLHVTPLFDTIVVSAEVGWEKPSREIFDVALRQMGIADPSRVLHVGDDRRNDVEGGLAAGLNVWHWKDDVSGFKELKERVLGNVMNGDHGIKRDASCSG